MLSTKQKIENLLRKLPISNVHILIEKYRLNPDDKVSDLFKQLSDILFKKLKIAHMEEGMEQEGMEQEGQIQGLNGMPPEVMEQILLNLTGRQRSRFAQVNRRSRSLVENVMLLKPHFMRKYPEREVIGNNLRNIILNRKRIYKKLYDLIVLLNGMKKTKTNKSKSEGIKRCFELPVDPDEVRDILQHIGLYLPPRKMIVSLDDKNTSLPQRWNGKDEEDKDYNGKEEDDGHDGVDKNDIYIYTLARHLQTILPNNRQYYDLVKNLERLTVKHSNKKQAIFVHCEDEEAVKRWKKSQLYKFLKKKYPKCPILQVSKELIEDVMYNSLFAFDLWKKNHILRYMKGVYVLGLCEYYPNEKDPERPLLDGSCVLKYPLKNQVVTKHLFNFRSGVLYGHQKGIIIQGHVSVDPRDLIIQKYEFTLGNNGPNTHNKLLNYINYDLESRYEIETYNNGAKDKNKDSYFRYSTIKRRSSNTFTLEGIFLHQGRDHTTFNLEYVYNKNSPVPDISLYIDIRKERNTNSRIIYLKIKNNKPVKICYGDDNWDVAFGNATTSGVGKWEENTLEWKNLYLDVDHQDKDDEDEDEDEEDEDEDEEDEDEEEDEGYGWWDRTNWTYWRNEDEGNDEGNVEDDEVYDPDNDEVYDPDNDEGEDENEDEGEDDDDDE